ncbi:GAF domain-containing sensor histidine kinase [Nostoc sp.]|uniref:GAF domain-containing sensor histidine kinase n=1 Tax=Nostoc sp. TaxID=1180 RepID=UPI002FF16B12
MGCYDRAIAIAKANKYLYTEALANELTARLYLEWGKERIAQEYLFNAYYCYVRWGAKAKVDDLEKRYPQLLAPILQQREQSLNTTDSFLTLSFYNNKTSTSDSISETLDLATVLKASQTLSSEIELEKLLATLLQVTIENAGADKCVLMLLRDERLLIKGIVNAGMEPIVLQQIPVEESQDIPLELVYSVKHSLEPTVLFDATAEPRFASDSYILSQQPKSILCSPILLRGKFAGIVYLENNLTTGAFTSDRVNILNLLCTQAAISLENARLYAHEQEKSQVLQESLHKLQQSEMRFKELFEKSADAIMLWGCDGLVDCNQATVELFAYSHKDQLYSRHPSDISSEFQPDGQSSSEKTNVMIAKVLQTGCHRFEWIHKRANGEEFWAEVMLTRIPYNTTQIVHGVVRDISDRKLAEEEIQQAQLQIVQSEKMSALGNLVAGVAHEINNPVGFIAGNLQPASDYINDTFRLIDLYQQEYPDPTAAIQDEIEAIDLEYVREDLPKLISSMKLGIDRIREISNSLRTFSRADRDRKISFNIHEGIDSTILILRHRLKANGNRPEIEVVKKYGNLPQIECFPGQLNQVFMNIVANAIDALEESNQGRNVTDIKTNPNRITITTCRGQQKTIVVKIADNGTGIPEERRERIFDNLFTTKTVGKGTGLGLAIARQIVEDNHRGKLSCNSVLVKGTEFVIEIPVF